MCCRIVMMTGLAEVIQHSLTVFSSPRENELYLPSIARSVCFLTRGDQVIVFTIVPHVKGFDFFVVCPTGITGWIIEISYPALNFRTILCCVLLNELCTYLTDLTIVSIFLMFRQRRSVLVQLLMFCSGLEFTIHEHLNYSY